MSGQRLRLEDPDEDVHYALKLERLTPLGPRRRQPIFESWRAKIVRRREGRSLRVGDVRGCVVRLSASESDHVLLAADERSQLLLDYLEALRGGAEDLAEAILGLGVTPGDILIIGELWLKPAYRGQGLGLQAFYKFIEALSTGCTIAVCEPFPPQFSPVAKPDAVAAAKTEGLTRDKADAVRRLREYWGLLGFEPLDPQEPKYFWMSLEHRRPSLARVLRRAGAARGARG